jgi:hypothetical protein
MSRDYSITPGAYVSEQGSCSYAGFGVYVVETQTTASAGSLVKVWTGSAWVLKLLKVWTGSAWAAKPLKRWDGSNWITE